MKDTLVVNLFGAPGSGKSTGAAWVYSNLKLALPEDKDISVELVTEFAKDLVWDNNTEALSPMNQMFILRTLRFRRKS